MNVSAPLKDLPPGDPNRPQGFSVLSMANIPLKSSRLWSQIINVFLNTIIALFFLFFETRKYIDYRVRLKKEARRIENYTTMIQVCFYFLLQLFFPPNFIFLTIWKEIPVDPELDNEGLKEWVQKRFPYWKVIEVKRALVTHEIDKKLKEREKFCRKLEKSVAYFKKKGVKPKTRNGWNECFGPKIDAIEYYKNSIEQLEREIVHLQQVASEAKQTGVAFVSFDSIYSQAIASQIVLDRRINTWITSQAPEPRGVNWKALKVGIFSHQIRSAIIIALTVFLIIFWLIPVTFLQSLANLDTLQQIPWLSGIATKLKSSGSIVTGFIEGFLPSLILALFNQVLMPFIMKLLSSLQAFHSLVDEDLSFFTKMFWFNVFNTFLATTIIGSLGNFSSLKKFSFNSPKKKSWNSSTGFQ